MIRVRTKPTHITVRIGDAKERYTSAIHALHVIRVAMVENGETIEDTPKTQQSLAECVRRARAEFEAAIEDVQPGRKRAVCVTRETDDDDIEVSYYQTADHRHLTVNRRWGVSICEGDRCLRRIPQNISADDAIRQMGYAVAPGEGRL